MANNPLGRRSFQGLRTSAMHRSLHKSLRVLDAYDFEELIPDDEDLIERVPNDYDDPVERASKRQRVEMIATQYLKGRTPMILSASLRGPFDKKWNNPWHHKRDKGHTSVPLGPTRVTGSQDWSGDMGVTGNDGGHQGTVSSSSYTLDSKEKADETDEQRPTQDGMALGSVGAGNVIEEDNGQENEQTSSTASVATGHNDPSAADKFFSAQSERPNSQSNSSGSQWLKRRPRDGKQVGLDEPAGSEQSKSPSKCRNNTKDGKCEEGGHNRPRGTPTATRLVSSLPKPSVHVDHWKSSASAPMDISSPIEQPAQTVTNSTRTTGGQKQESCMSVLHRADASSAIIEGLRSAKRLAQTAIQEVISTSGRAISTPSREDIRRSAERCATGLDSTESTTIKVKRKRSTGAKSKKNVAAPLAPASSGSFTYRKLNDGKTAASGTAQEPKRQGINSVPSHTSSGETSETAAMQAAQEDGRLTQNGAMDIQDNGHTNRTRRSDIYDVPASDDDDMTGQPIRDDGGRKSGGSSRHSLVSTQAAMMLAQMEFQEASIPSIASETPRPQLHIQENTPQSLGSIQDLSPAITPLSEFAAQLDKRQPPPDSIIRPMSTQDLFAAASPYAFSVKKPVLSKRSNLRFAVLSNEGHDNERSRKSPTPSGERIPLKERNSRVSFRGMSGSEKGSQESLGHSPRRLEEKVELPRLSLDSSLNGNLSFTGQFLNLDSVT